MVSDGGADGLRRTDHPVRGRRGHEGGPLDQFVQVMTPEPGRHPVVADRVLRPPSGLTDRVEQEGLDEASELRDGTEVGGEFSVGCLLERPLAGCVTDRRGEAFGQVAERGGEEIHTPIVARGSDIPTPKTADRTRNPQIYV